MKFYPKNHQKTKGKQIEPKQNHVELEPLRSPTNKPREGSWMRLTTLFFPANPRSWSTCPIVSSRRTSSLESRAIGFLRTNSRSHPPIRSPRLSAPGFRGMAWGAGLQQHPAPAVHPGPLGSIRLTKKSSGEIKRSLKPCWSLVGHVSA